jgi:Baseplate J-like protein
MPLPIPNLDDRRFDDLVAEAKARLRNHLPELTQIAPGDPVHAIVDLFAFFTETILYRANLIPERQRRVLLNLLQIPVRNAKPSRGLVCLDAGPRTVNLPSLVRDGVQLKAGEHSFTGIGEIQPTPLNMSVGIKQIISEQQLLDMGLTKQDLQEHYGLHVGETPQAFQPQYFTLGKDTLSLDESLDQFFYLALSVPKTLLNKITEVREELAGITLNIALAPADNLEAEQISELTPRRLRWELLSQNDDGNLVPLPLEVVSDTTQGGRQLGVVRLRLPRNAQLFDSLTVSDPMFAGLGDLPPELPEPLTSERVALWLRLSCPDDPLLTLGYLDVNGLEVIGQALKQDLVLGVGTGMPDQVVTLPDTAIDPDSLILEVEEEGLWVAWQRVDFLVDLGSDARVYKLDAQAGQIYFGDGLEGGKRPPVGKRIRAASYRAGGGSSSNLPADSIKELSSGNSRVSVRHHWPLTGGIDAESVVQAERRIPQFLTHRNRAVTKQDFQLLAVNNPINPVARAEVKEGFLPGSNINAVRENVPGVVSIFVIPPRLPALAQNPKPTKGLLKDVYDYLQQRLVIGTELYVLSPQFIPLAVSVNVDVIDAITEQQTLRDVEAALVDYLWPLAPGGARGEGWPMGGNVQANELEAQVARVPGVKAVKALALFQKTNTSINGSVWQRLAKDVSLVLASYQLPELLGVSASTANGEPQLPGGLEASAKNNRVVPAPVVPQLC